MQLFNVFTIPQNGKIVRPQCGQGWLASPSLTVHQERPKVSQRVSRLLQSRRLLPPLPRTTVLSPFRFAFVKNPESTTANMACSSFLPITIAMWSDQGAIKLIKVSLRGQFRLMTRSRLLRRRQRPAKSASLVEDICVTILRIVITITCPDEPHLIPPESSSETCTTNWIHSPVVPGDLPSPAIYTITD